MITLYRPFRAGTISVRGSVSQTFAQINNKLRGILRVSAGQSVLWLQRSGYFRKRTRVELLFVSRVIMAQTLAGQSLPCNHERCYSNRGSYRAGDFVVCRCLENPALTYM